jgi:hypothetical protein
MKTEKTELKFSSEAILNRKYLVDLLDFGDFEVQSLCYDGETLVECEGEWSVRGFEFQGASMCIRLNEKVDDAEYAEDLLNLEADDFQIDEGKLVSIDIDLLDSVETIQEAGRELELSDEAIERAVQMLQYTKTNTPSVHSFVLGK